jgi:hypothetical protein
MRLMRQHVREANVYRWPGRMLIDAARPGVSRTEDARLTARRRKARGFLRDCPSDSPAARNRRELCSQAQDLQSTLAGLEPASNSYKRLTAAFSEGDASSPGQPGLGQAPAPDLKAVEPSRRSAPRDRISGGSCPPPLPAYRRNPAMGRPRHRPTPARSSKAGAISLALSATTDPIFRFSASDMTRALFRVQLRATQYYSTSRRQSGILLGSMERNEPLKRWKNVLAPIAVMTVLVVPVFGSPVVGGGRGQQWESEAEAATIQFDIPAEPLSTALLDFGRQAQVSLLLPSRPLEGFVSAPVQGNFSRDDALARLLRCLPFRGRIRDNTLIIIHRDGSALGEDPPPTSFACEAGGALVS